MKTTLAMLLATTVLSAAVGLPVWSAARATADVETTSIAAIDNADQAALPLVLAENDDDDDDDGEDDDDDECDDDDGACGATVNPAPAGTVAPPQNGLFGTGAAPQVQVK